jgi:hypothetical protein
MRSFYLELSDVLVVVPGGQEVEAAYHKRFASSRVDEDGRRELFRIDHRLSFFLGLWRHPAQTTRRRAIPLSMMPRSEVGNYLALDQELRQLECGGYGPWDAETVEKAADIIGRLTYLCVTGPDDGDDEYNNDAERYVGYWNVTHEQALEEWRERRSVPLREYFPKGQQWKVGLRNWRGELEMQRLIKAHADRAAIIRDLFVEALEGYESKATTRAGAGV